MKYKVHFTNGDVLEFKSDDIDFHEIRIGLILFDNSIINLTNVTYMEKEADDEQTDK